MGIIWIKSVVDPEKGVTLLSIIKPIHNRSRYLLMDLSGNLTEMQ
jgi:hypothetical protein